MFKLTVKKIFKIFSIKIFAYLDLCLPQSELPRPIPWNQTSDVHLGSTLIM